MVRKQITKKVRFEVFKRDSFKCQYCGESSPDVILEVDHIIPVVEGGTNDMINLVSACFDCNRGKGKRILSDKKQFNLEKEELEVLKNRKEQVELYVKWKKELIEFQSIEFDKLQDLLRTIGREWTDTGKCEIVKLIKKYGFNECYDSLEICINQYDKEFVVQKLPKVLASRKKIKDHPELEQLYYFMVIIKKRFFYFDERKAIELMKLAFSKGVSLDDLSVLSKTSKNWTDWNNGVNECINVIKL